MFEGVVSSHMRHAAPERVNCKTKWEECDLIKGHFHEAVYAPLQLGCRIGVGGGWQNANLSQVRRVA
jgi:hypothetical protein